MEFLAPVLGLFIGDVKCLFPLTSRFCLESERGGGEVEGRRDAAVATLQGHAQPGPGSHGDFVGLNSGKCDYKKRYEGGAFLSLTPA